MRELLDFLPPAMPITISNSSDSPTPHPALGLQDGSQVLAAIEQRDRVWWIDLQDLRSALLEKMAKMMQETFPTLKYLRLCAADEPPETQAAAPVLLPGGFLGGSAPRLETLKLKGIPFPELSKLLLSTNDLVHFVLEKIPDSGYISPEAMIAGLSTCTKLERLVIEFSSEDPPRPWPEGGPDGPDPTSQEESITSVTLARVSLPVLNHFNFDGNGRYFDAFASRIECLLLACDSKPFSQHDTSVIRHVHYEASFTKNGFSSRYCSRPLIIPVLDDE